jgi:hypothetical protein
MMDLRLRVVFKFVLSQKQIMKQGSECEFVWKVIPENVNRKFKRLVREKKKTEQ